MAVNTETYVAFKSPGQREWYSFVDKWVVTKLGGLRAPVEYSPQGYAGSMGSALGGGYARGLEVSVELMFGDPDPLKVAAVVTRLCKALPSGGPATTRFSVYPLGFESIYEVNVATGGPSVEYSHGGCLATASIELYANDYRFRQLAPGPGEEGVFPW